MTELPYTLNQALYHLSQVESSLSEYFNTHPLHSSTKEGYLEPIRELMKDIPLLPSQLLPEQLSPPTAAAPPEASAGGPFPQPAQPTAESIAKGDNLGESQHTGSQDQNAISEGDRGLHPGAPGDTPEHHQQNGHPQSDHSHQDG